MLVITCVSIERVIKVLIFVVGKYMNDSETRLPFLLALCLSVFIYKNLPQGNVQAVDKSSSVQKTTVINTKALLTLNLESKSKQFSLKKS